MTDRRPTDLVESLVQCRVRHPGRAALTHGARSISFDELHHRAAAVASNFAALGLTGRAVGVFTPTVPELAVVYYGAFMSGTTVVPINYSFRAGELRTVLANCRLDALVADASLTGVVREAGGVASAIPRKYLVGRAGPDDVGFAPYQSLETPARAAYRKAPGRPAVIFHTSGTTGRPKGVVHTLASVSHFADCYQTLCRGESDPVTLVARNCYHSGGFYHLTGALSAGATCVLADDPAGFDAEAFVRGLEAYRVTQVFLSVSMLNAMLGAPNLSARALRHAAFISAGADEVKPSHHDRLRRYTDLPLTVRYSSTEATCVSIGAAAEPGLRARSVGRPFRHFEWRLDAVPDGSGVGELLLKGTAVFQGYHNNPQANAAAFTPDGWYRTGDLFRPDGAGGLEFCGRRHDAIKVGGKFVYPEEIEAVATSYPGVAEAVAVAAPHPVHIQVPHLFIRLRSPEGVFDIDALRAYLGEQLSAYKVPPGVVVVPELPVTPAGKTDRKLLASRATPPPTHRSVMLSQVATDVIWPVAVPPGMVTDFCPITRTTWLVRRDAPQCPACGFDRVGHVQSRPNRSAV